jgi:hypothetical protein
MMQPGIMIRILLTALMIAGMAMAPAARALEIEGVRIDEKVTLSRGGPEVVLNGAGVRHKLVFVKAYVGSLYLTHKMDDRGAILAYPGAKRVSMHILSDEITASELIASMNNALAANLLPHELALLEKRIRDLNRMMSSIKALKRGSVVLLDYLPDIGTRVTIDGEQKITIPGADFFPAMLQIWIGLTPVDGRLRDAMLGGAPRGFKLF